MQITKFGPAESKEYYEAEMQRKILYIPNLSNLLNMVNLQVLKLPHELQDPSLNAPAGSTYADIVQSFCNGVDVIMANLSPKIKQYNVKYTPPNEEGLTDFQKALHKLAWIYDLLDQADALNDSVLSRDMDEEGAYDDNLDARDMPDANQAADDEALGPVGSQDQ